MDQWSRAPVWWCKFNLVLNPLSLSLKHYISSLRGGDLDKNYLTPSPPPGGVMRAPGGSSAAHGGALGVCASVLSSAVCNIWQDLKTDTRESRRRKIESRLQTSTANYNGSVIAGGDPAGWQYDSVCAATGEAWPPRSCCSGVSRCFCYRNALVTQDDKCVSELKRSYPDFLGGFFFLWAADRAYFLNRKTSDSIANSHTPLFIRQAEGKAQQTFPKRIL